MSLDVSLTTTQPHRKALTSGIFVRENGQTKEISIEEWNKKNPATPVTVMAIDDDETNEVFSYNITHNLGEMAKQADLYLPLWRPEEVEIYVAKDLIQSLRNGLHKLKLEPEKYRKFNPDNGWGTYELLVEFVSKYLDACYEFPDAEVRVSR